MPQANNFTLDEVDSIYVLPNERYVVSLIVGYGDGAHDGVTTAKQAADAALQLTRNEGSEDTTWFVHDRRTGVTTSFEQREFAADLW